MKIGVTVADLKIKIINNKVDIHGKNRKYIKKKISKNYIKNLKSNNIDWLLL